MRNRYGVLQSVLDLLVPIHSDGHKFLGVSLGLTVLGFLVWTSVGWVFAALTLGLAFFFRDPHRVTQLREGLVIAPADGRVVSVELAPPPPELGMVGGARIRISIFLSIFDMHVNRSPIAGTLMRSVYVPGAFFSAASDKASEDNERRALVIETPKGAEIAVLQIAGMITRRILTFVSEGDTVGVGQRIGFIRFGSRVDVFLPVGQAALVSVGQRVVAGETVLADLKSTEPERDARRS